MVKTVCGDEQSAPAADFGNDSVHLISKTLTMSIWVNMATVAAGGAIGSSARYLIAVGSVAIPGGSTMIGTTVANVLGCAAIGAFGEYSLVDELVSDRAKLAIRVGFLGGLTTFSTFAAESSALAGTARMGAASWYVGANLIGGWAALLIAAALVRHWMA